jgi:hypothetical protein
MSDTGWIGVDLDGTLAHYDGWKGVDHIGDPIKPMVKRVKTWLGQGKTVKVFTARVHGHGKTDLRTGSPVDVITPIEEWCLKHIGEVLPVTNIKDFGMVELWDDRSIQVEPNTGRWVGEKVAEGEADLRAALREALSIIHNCATLPRPSHTGPCCPGATPCDGECSAAYYAATTMAKLERLAGA